MLHVFDVSYNSVANIHYCAEDLCTKIYVSKGFVYNAIIYSMEKSKGMKTMEEILQLGSKILGEFNKDYAALPFM